MWSMGVLDQDVRLAEGDLAALVGEAREKGFEVSCNDAGHFNILINSPLMGVRYWPDTDMALFILGYGILDAIDNVQTYEVLSLLHIAENQNFFANIQKTSTHIVGKVYQRIQKKDMFGFADYITRGDGEIWASIGLRPVPNDVNPDFFRHQLHAEVWRKFVYLHPEFNGLNHQFAGGSVMIERLYED